MHASMIIEQPYRNTSITMTEYVGLYKDECVFIVKKKVTYIKKNVNFVILALTRDR